MAHPEQRDFLTRLKTSRPELFHNVTVIEIGSLDINGTVRDFFQATGYLGVDVGDGPGVDLVARGELLDFPDNTYDIAISAECFEHNPAWAETFLNMWRMTNTAIIFTCASEGREEHGTHDSHPTSSPLTLDWDYYRNLNVTDFTDKFNLEEMFIEHAFEYNPASCDLYFWGIKKA